MPAWPAEKLSFVVLLQWLLSVPVIPASKEHAEELIAAAVRGMVGCYFPTTKSDISRPAKEPRTNLSGSYAAPAICAAAVHRA
jgi:hypothetical protein